MSQKLAATEVGDCLWFAPPHRTAKVPLWPEELKKKKKKEKDNVEAIEGKKAPAYGFIAGGTGIAPAYQLISHVIDLIERGVSVPQLTLLFSNRKRADVLLYDELQEIQEKYPTIKCEFTLTGEKVDGFRFGRINAAMISEVLPHEKIDHVFVSGPAGMWESSLSILRGNGYEEQQCTELEA